MRVKKIKALKKFSINFNKHKLFYNFKNLIKLIVLHKNNLTFY